MMFVRCGDTILQATLISSSITTSPAGSIRAIGANINYSCEKGFKNVRAVMDRIVQKIQAGDHVIDLDNIERDEGDPPFKTIELG